MHIHSDITINISRVMNAIENPLFLIMAPQHAIEVAASASWNPNKRQLHCTDKIDSGNYTNCSEVRGLSFDVYTDNYYGNTNWALGDSALKAQLAFVSRQRTKRGTRQKKNDQSKECANRVKSSVHPPSLCECIQFLFFVFRFLVEI